MSYSFFFLLHLGKAGHTHVNSACFLGPVTHFRVSSGCSARVRTNHLLPSVRQLDELMVILVSHRQALAQLMQSHKPITQVNAFLFSPSFFFYQFFLTAAAEVTNMTSENATMTCRWAENLEFWQSCGNRMRSRPPIVGYFFLFCFVVLFFDNWQQPLWSAGANGPFFLHVQCEDQVCTQVMADKWTEHYEHVYQEFWFYKIYLQCSVRQSQRRPLIHTVYMPNLRLCLYSLYRMH